MSELKSVYIDRTGDWVRSGNDTGKFYLKSEVDKVLADNNKDIAELTDKLQNVSEILKETREWLIESQKMHKRCADNAVKIIRHHKYKRCLAMAMWCESEMNYWYDSTMREQCPRFKFYEKWYKRWLELAEEPTLAKFLQLIHKEVK